MRERWQCRSAYPPRHRLCHQAGGAARARSRAPYRMADKRGGLRRGPTAQNRFGDASATDQIRPWRDAVAQLAAWSGWRLLPGRWVGGPDPARPRRHGGSSRDCEIDKRFQGVPDNHGRLCDNADVSVHRGRRGAAAPPYVYPPSPRRCRVQRPAPIRTPSPERLRPATAFRERASLGTSRCVDAALAPNHEMARHAPASASYLTRLFQRSRMLTQARLQTDP